MKIVIFWIITILTVVNSNLIINLHTHAWCPPCKKAKAIFQRLQKIYPSIKFEIHKYSNKTLILSNKTGSSLPFPTIIFSCNQYRFIYQNDLSFAQISYWIDIVCLKKIPSCNQKINEELYRIILQKIDVPPAQLINQILRHPHIKICLSETSNKTSQQVIKILKETDSKTFYFDYFSNNLRNYLIQSQKLAITIITSQKNTSKVNSFVQSYASLHNFMNGEIVNQSQIYRYQLLDQHKQQLQFIELCYNANISKCIYNDSRKSQVQTNMKMIEKLLHFLDIPMQTNGNFQQVIAFRFNYPHLQKHVYHHFGTLDEKFIFWINQILTITQKEQKKQQQCYWNSIIHRISDNNLEDIETHLRLSKLIKQRSNNVAKFTLNKIVKNYHSQPKFTICIQGKKPFTYTSNKQLDKVQKLIHQYDMESIPQEL